MPLGKKTEQFRVNSKTKPPEVATLGVSSPYAVEQTEASYRLFVII